MKYIKLFEDINFEDINFDDIVEEEHNSIFINLNDRRKNVFYEIISLSTGDEITFDYKGNIFNGIVISDYIPGKNKIITIELDININTHNGTFSNIRKKYNIPFGKNKHCYNIEHIYDMINFYDILHRYFNKV